MKQKTAFLFFINTAIRELIFISAQWHGFYLVFEEKVLHLRNYLPHISVKFQLPVLVMIVFLAHSILWAQNPVFTPDTVNNYHDTIPLVQKDDFIKIDKIFIVGNRQTKEKIITRELDFEEGSFLLKSELESSIEQNRKKIMNTRLFLTTDISLVWFSDIQADVIIRVAERWYTIPSPFVKLADRNFNEWFTNQGREWNRLEYGMRFFKYNFRGRNERLYLYAQGGFTKQFAFRYLVPYIDQAQKNGLVFTFSYAETNNIAYQTRDHVLQYTDSLRDSQLSLVGGIGWTLRSSFYDNHSALVSYHDERVNDTILAMNNSYYLNGELRQQFFSLSYTYTNDHRDYIGYPLEGYYWQVEARKLGLGLFDDINIFRLYGVYSLYTALGKNFYYAGSVRGYFSAPKRQPYSYFKGFGYDGAWPRGYELYAIEGQSYLLQQNTLSYRVFSRNFNLEKIIPIKQFSQIPINIYLKSFIDQGFVDNPIPYAISNRLSNRYLIGGGLGIDIVTYYDAVLRIEYSLNREQQQQGLRISAKAAF